MLRYRLLQRVERGRYVVMGASRTDRLWGGRTRGALFGTVYTRIWGSGSVRTKNGGTAVVRLLTEWSQPTTWPCCLPIKVILAVALDMRQPRWRHMNKVLICGLRLVPRRGWHRRLAGSQNTARRL